VGRDMIVEAAPVVSGPRPADRNIASNAIENDGVYRPSRRLERIRDNFERQGKDPEAFVRSHVHRLEALRRAGHAERIDADHWKIPKDIVERGQAYDLSQGGDGLKVRTLSALNLDQQIGSDGATWLDRELTARERLPVADGGFGREVKTALNRRAMRLVDMGFATAKDGNIHIPSRIVATLEQQEVERVGQQMARERGLTYTPSNGGEYVSGRLAGVASLVSGRFAMIENGLGLPACALAADPRQAHRPAHHRLAAGRWWHRVDLGKEEGAQPIVRRTCEDAPGKFGCQGCKFGQRSCHKAGHVECQIRNPSTCRAPTASRLKLIGGRSSHWAGPPLSGQGGRECAPR